MGEHRASLRWFAPRRSVAAARASQRGWIGLVGLLIALVIVAVLAQSVLKSHGLIGGAERAARVAPGQAAAGDAAQPAAPAISPMERAHGLEREMQRDAQDLSRRIDEQTK